jgi:transposase-like protein
MTSAPRLETIPPWLLRIRGIVVVGQPTSGDARRRGGSITMDQGDGKRDEHGSSGQGLRPMRPVRYWFAPTMTLTHHVVEQDHRFVKRCVKLGMGFGAFHTAQQTIQGYEAMHRLRKGQLEGLTKGNILAQSRIINQLFGVTA